MLDSLKKAMQSCVLGRFARVHSEGYPTATILKPDGARGQFFLKCEGAEGYIDLGLLEDAYKLLEALPTRAKISKEVITLHMSILVKSGQPLKASYLGENLCFGDPDNAGLMVEVGQLKHDAGEYTEVLKWLQSVEGTCRRSASFHHLRAKCHAALGDLEACASALREAHKIDPPLKMQSLEDPVFGAIYSSKDL